LLENLKEILSKEFGPSVYSVLSCGKAGGVEQRLLAVVKEVEEKEKKQQEENAQEEQKEGKKESSKKTFKIIKMYWL